MTTTGIMPPQFDESEVAKKKILVVPIIDTSGSMDGKLIGTVNQAMREIGISLKDINQSATDAEIKIAPLLFSSVAEWHMQNNQPENVEQFVWRDVNANGATAFGHALELLYEKLTDKSKGGWMDTTDWTAPILVLMTDGEPTDDWQTPLNKLQTRGWFKTALKYALQLDNAVNMDILTKFTSTIETVVNVSTTKNMKSIVKTVLVRASQVKSTTPSQHIGNFNMQVAPSTPDDINQKANDAMVKSVMASVNEVDEDSF